jgi:ribonuclease P/MRP protein subunit RPP1
MLYDLNVPWSATQNPLELQRTISFLSESGYDTLALNHIITGTLPPQIMNLIPHPPPFSIPSKTTLLRRCTLLISDPSLNHRLPALSSIYDILALRPTSEKAFLAACLNITDHSIISLDLTQRFPFHFKPKPLMTAVNRGIRFEICYAQATMEDAGARRNFISNCLGILRATKGRGLVVSSEAKSVLGVRAPADVINLMAVWGLGREKGMESLTVNPRGVVVNDRIKRTSFRGVIDVIDGGERQPGKGAKTGPGGKDQEIPVNGSGAGKKGKGKRKIDDKEGGGDGTPQISKRQAKKMRLEALKAGKELSSAPKDAISPKDPAGDSREADTHSTIKTKGNG